MPLFATVLLGLAGQAAWKLATYLYDRVTAPSPAAAGTTAPAAASFERALAEAGPSNGAVRSDVMAGPPLRLPAATAATVGFPGSPAGARPEAGGVADLYRRMAEEVQAP
jgi:hypothetical protein